MKGRIKEEDLNTLVLKCAVQHWKALLNSVSNVVCPVPFLTHFHEIHNGYHPS